MSTDRMMKEADEALRACMPFPPYHVASSTSSTGVPSTFDSSPSTACSRSSYSSWPTDTPTLQDEGHQYSSFGSPCSPSILSSLPSSPWTPVVWWQSSNKGAASSPTPFAPPSAKLDELLDHVSSKSHCGPSWTGFVSTRQGWHPINDISPQSQHLTEAPSSLPVDSAPLPPQRRSKPEKYKTELCEKWTEQGQCPYGNICQYAHGKAELRMVQRHPKYKTVPCTSFLKNGTCSYGKRCTYLHYTSLEEAKTKEQESGSVCKAPLLARVGVTSGIRRPTTVDVGRGEHDQLAQYAALEPRDLFPPQITTPVVPLVERKMASKALQTWDWLTRRNFDDVMSKTARRGRSPYVCAE